MGRWESGQPRYRMWELFEYGRWWLLLIVCFFGPKNSLQQPMIVFLSFLKVTRSFCCGHKSTVGQQQHEQQHYIACKTPCIEKSTCDGAPCCTCFTSCVMWKAVVNRGSSHAHTHTHTHTYARTRVDVICVQTKSYAAKHEFLNNRHLDIFIRDSHTEGRKKRKNELPWLL